MTQSLVAQALLPRLKIALDSWSEDTRLRAERVARFRRYADGDHDHKMTAEMRQLLQLKAGQGFADNYQDIIIQTMGDRLHLSAIDADNDPASEWSKKVLAFNRIDAMQGDVHEGAIRDGDTFVMGSYDNDKQMVRFTHEPAYDGTSGVIPVYLSEDVAEMQCAVKIWHVINEGGVIRDTVRINTYYPDAIEKKVSNDGSTLAPFQDDSTDENGVVNWTNSDGSPIGIPLVHFRNRGRKNWGLSEIENTIPLQDVTNRFLHSFVMAAELTAFRIYVAKGFTPPAGLTPGMILELTRNGGPLAKDDLADFTALDGSDLTQYIAALQWTVGEMGKVSRTPAPEFMGGDNASGEALKQREIGLIGKVERFQVKCGNSWEDVMGLAHRIDTAFGVKNPPACERFFARWNDAEIRNDDLTIKNAMLLRPMIGDEETLRIIAPIFEWDEKRIQDIMKNIAKQRMSSLTDIMTTMPQFSPRPPNGQQPPVEAANASAA